MQAMLGPCQRQYWHTECRHALSPSAARDPVLCYHSTALYHRTVRLYREAARRGGQVAFAQHKVPAQAKQHQAPFQGIRASGARKRGCCKTRALAQGQPTDLAVWTSLAVCAAAAQVPPPDRNTCMSAWYPQNSSHDVQLTTFPATGIAGQDKDRQRHRKPCSGYRCWPAL